MRIGITGGIGSGKTLICRIFETMGIEVYYADKEARRIVNHNVVVKERIKKLLGDAAYHSNGRLNRGYVASLVFKDKALLESLNSIIHPAVRDDFESWADRQNSAYVLEESAIVFEADLGKYFKAVILVVADKDIRIERVMKRDKISRKEVVDRMNNQMSDREKEALADFIIINDGSRSLLQQVYEIHSNIMKSYIDES